MTAQPHNFSAAQWKSMAAALGVNVVVTADAFGRTDVRLDREAMIAFRDGAAALGFPDIAAVFAQALGPGGAR
ncbi:hypothetical protein ACH43Y_14180 [Streptomyces rubiginosohelvolus]|uniref:hypothetical protein n=1 Tax=Streptomyces rubiginosohelvolus TaxID=67362 RepID=UPI0037B55687